MQAKGNFTPNHDPNGAAPRGQTFCDPTPQRIVLPRRILLPIRDHFMGFRFYSVFMCVFFYNVLTENFATNTSKAPWARATDRRHIFTASYTVVRGVLNSPMYSNVQTESCFMDASAIRQ